MINEQNKTESTLKLESQVSIQAALIRAIRLDFPLRRFSGMKKQIRNHVTALRFIRNARSIWASELYHAPKIRKNILK
jgi:hypothetical protein